MANRKLSIVMRATSSLIPRKNNPRTHSRRQIRKIAASIEEFGFLSPILVDQDLTVVAGHGRLEAAKHLKLANVPTVCVGHLSPAQIRAYVIADNKLATEAGWDKELLAIEVEEISLCSPEFDITLTGFEIDEIELLRDVADTRQREFEDQVPELPTTPVTRRGDLWTIGSHRLLCGDATNLSCYHTLLGDARADLVITDPPYNVPIAGHVAGLGKHKYREFCMASGELTRDQFRRFLSAVCNCLVRSSKSGSLHYIFMDWRSIGDLLLAGEEHYTELLNLIVWKKTNAGMGAFYRSQHELAALFKHGRRSHKNNVQLGANGRYRTNVWEYPGVNSLGKTRDEFVKAHPTVKNAQMIADAIRDASDRGDVVLDPFGGSGTSLVAVHRSERKARLMELDPQYCDVIIERAITEGLDVVLSSDDRPFAEVRHERMNKQATTKFTEENM